MMEFWLDYYKKKLLLCFKKSLDSTANLLFFDCLSKNIWFSCDNSVYFAINIDECTTLNGACDVDANYQNTRGCYVCSCKAGFT